MDSFGDSSWDFLDYNFIDQNTCNDFSWLNQSAGTENNFSANCAVPQTQECTTKECTRKRGRHESFCTTGTKACREKLRRERLNDRFRELSSVLEPGRPAKTDKLALVGDAIRVLNQLRTEAQELKGANENLQEEINNLKVIFFSLWLLTTVEIYIPHQAEKNELREEKSMLKADKGMMEQHLKAMTDAAFMPPHPAAYHAGASKMAVFPNYGLIPMWQYLPPSAVDTSHDHELRPPAA